MSTATYAQMVQACNERIEEAWQQAEAHYGRTFDRVPVEYSARLTSTAGKACYRIAPFSGVVTNTKITLASKIMTTNFEDFLKGTPGHEVAHLVANVVYGGKCGHDYRWQEVMRVIGQEPRRCHNYDVTAVQTNRVPAYCGCAEPHMITKQRINKIQRGAVYTCKTCRVSLTLRPEAAKVTINIKPVVKKAANAKAPAKRTAKGRTKASYVQNIIEMYPNMPREEMVLMAKRKNKQEGWGIPTGSVRTYVINNMKKVGR